MKYIFLHTWQIIIWKYSRIEDHIYKRCQDKKKGKKNKKKYQNMQRISCESKVWKKIIQVLKRIISFQFHFDSQSRETENRTEYIVLRIAKNIKISYTTSNQYKVFAVA